MISRDSSTAVLAQAWGVSAIALGTWEAVAVSTRRVPTVSATVWRILGCRHRRIAQVAVVAYTAGLAHHLLGPPA